MSEWQPIETVRAYLCNLEHLIEKNKGGCCIWGEVIVWSKKCDAGAEGAYFANFYDWGEKNTSTHWRNARSYEDNALEPTHWMPPLDPPVSA